MREWGSVGTSVRDRKAKRGLLITEGPHNLSHRRFILIFSFIGYFQLFLVYLEK